jgi:trans-2,3-dihydro-3-hydroxyanthranilate isomerase
MLPASMLRRYVTVDVFTDRPFGGNPLAVVLEAEGLSSQQMQAVANEFNYSETTFVLPPRDPRHTAHVRLFTARTEVPFAGHPNVGTAVALARELIARGAAASESFVFEEGAGLVPMRLLRAGSEIVGAELTAPGPLSVGASVSLADAAECLSLPEKELSSGAHPPQVLSVGLPFLVVEVLSRAALGRAKPDWAAHERVLPPIGTDAVFTYFREAADHLHARVFAPLDATIEDPATGSAAAAAIARLATLDRAADAENIDWRIDQGVDMGRPSLILGRTEKRNGKLRAVRIAGHVVPVMQGVLSVP